MASQNNEEIGKYINRADWQEDTDFVLKSLNDVYTKFKQVKDLKVDLGGASTFKTVGDAASKLKVEMDELQKIEQQLIKTYEKRQAQTSDQALALAGEKEALRQKNVELKNSVIAQESANGSIRQMRADVNLLTQQYDALSKTERESAKGTELQAKISNQVKAIKDLEFATQRFQRNVGNYSGAVQVLEKSLQEVKGKLDEMAAAGNTNTDAFETLQREFGALNNVVNSQAHGFVSMREEIKSNQAAIEQLSLVYGEDSEIVRSLILENGKLRDSFSDLKATQKAVGSDTFAFDALLQGAQTLVGVYSAAQGAAALFGKENEDLQKTMVKLQAAMALVQGVQAVVNSLQKESSLVQGVMAVRTAALAAAQRLYAFATGGATVATNVFRTALLATGIGAVLVLLSSAASAMGLFGDKTSGAKSEVDNLADSLQALNDETARIEGNLKQQSDETVARLKLSGATDKEVHEQQKKNLLENRELLRTAMLEASDASTKAQFNDKLTADEKQKLQDISLASEKKYYDNEHEITLLDLDFQLDQKDKRLKAEKEAGDKLKELRTKNSKEAEELNQRELKAQFDIIKLTKQRLADNAKAAAEDESNSFDVRILNLGGFVKEQQRIIQAQAEFEIKTKKLTAIEIEALQAQATDQQIKVAQEGSNLLSEIERQRVEKNKETNKLEVDEEGALMKKMAALTDKFIKEKEEKDKKEQKAEEKKIELTKKRAEAIRSLSDELKGLAFDLLTDQIEKQKNAIQGQIDTLDKQKAKDIDVANATITNAQDKAAAIATIEARAQAQKEQLELRQRQLDEKKAKYDKAKAIVDIIENTTIAVVGALKPDGITPLPARVALATLIGAIGAAQLARVIAQPIPHYATGTEDHPGGLAMVGDGGRSELVVTPQGELFQTPSTNTLVDLPKHSVVLPDANTFLAMSRSVSDRALSFNGKSNSLDTTVFKSEMKQLRETVKNIPQPIIKAEGKIKRWTKLNGGDSLEEFINKNF